jgi:dTDP-glucose pyrophosphorylase
MPLVGYVFEVDWMKKWIFPIAGLGTRTAQFGKFKPLIKVGGRPILEWALRGIEPLLTQNDEFIFITTEAFEKEFNVKKSIREILTGMGIDNSIYLSIAKKTPPGPAASVHVAARSIEGDDLCVVVNADQYAVFEIPAQVIPSHAFMPIYFNTSSSSSYACIENNHITAVHEKEKVSLHASIGVYGFGSGNRLLHALENLFSSGETVNGEYYVGPALNHIIKEGGTVLPTRTFAKFDLGNPNGIKRFSNTLNAFLKFPVSV